MCEVAGGNEHIAGLVVTCQVKDFWHCWPFLELLALPQRVFNVWGSLADGSGLP